jgi:hypothetical protein
LSSAVPAFYGISSKINPVRTARHVHPEQSSILAKLEEIEVIGSSKVKQNPALPLVSIKSSKASSPRPPLDVYALADVSGLLNIGINIVQQWLVAAFREKDR